jgi:hypothetical protein
VNSTGIFSLFILFSSITLLAGIQAFNHQHILSIQKNQTILLSLEKANFIRSNLEIEFDKLIQTTLQEGIQNNESASQTTFRMNQKLLEGIQLIEEDEDVKIKFNDKEFLEQFSIIYIPFSKGNVAGIFTYHGGKKRDARFTATIYVNDIQQEFEIPIGYRQCVLKEWEEFEC